MSPRGALPETVGWTDLSYVDVEDFLTALGVDVAYLSFGEAGFRCQFHGDHRPSARMSTETTAWICHGCGERGNAISFLARIRDLTYPTARRVLEERYGGSLTAPIDDLASELERIFHPPESVDTRVAPDERWVKRFHVPWTNAYGPIVDYMIVERRFRADILERWEVGYDLLSDRVAIPVRGRDGVLVGFRGRAYKPGHTPKYLVLGNSPNPDYPRRYGDDELPPFDTYAKSEVVFGLDHAQGEDLIIVEGELNAIAMDMHGFSTAVSVAGSEFSSAQARQIISRARRATIFFDGDDAGRKGVSKVREELRAYIPADIIVDPPADAAELDRDGVQLLIEQAMPALQYELTNAMTRAR